MATILQVEKDIFCGSFHKMWATVTADVYREMFTRAKSTINIDDIVNPHLELPSPMTTCILVRQ